MDSEGYSAGTCLYGSSMYVWYCDKDKTDTEFLRKDAEMKQQPVSLESFQYKNI